MRTLSSVLMLALAIGLVPVRALAQHADGTRRGTISTPVGDLTLVVRIEAHWAGALSGTLESVDQAPGRLIALTSIDAGDDTRTLTLAPLGARCPDARGPQSGRHPSGPSEEPNTLTLMATWINDRFAR